VVPTRRGVNAGEGTVAHPSRPSGVQIGRNTPDLHAGWTRLEPAVLVLADGTSIPRHAPPETRAGDEVGEC
jgi:hypothetical protein